ncbi:hypothetical protein A1O1_03680 [Capronia coronata CBS 617.96]|uniref:Protein ATS1 n=1 Tax=Capronia coronata CBS 617.96 TaxID=1182541 RepID=W9YCG6_9EURO|nr:uncharacterized protein A1O1_03680 [Capronia coronata CBS 617.96]EXJ90577.1 hypothetical protein A1O1_03680 [Capronia coronata CBS 617.96]
MPVVYAFGSNGSGQLGIGHTEDTARPEKCVFQPSSTRQVDDDQHATEAAVTMAQRYANVNVNKMVAGGNHTLLLTNDGRLFSAGKFGCRLGDKESTSIFVQRRFGSAQLGTTSVQAVPPSASTPSTPQSVRTEDTQFPTGVGRITDIAATWDASFIVVDHRTVFVCGTGSKGELGLGEGVERAESMTKLFDVADFQPEPGRDATAGVADDDGKGDKKGHVCGGETPIQILAIAACMAHAVLLLSNGHVVGWGNCRKGQLGERVKDRKALWTPTTIAPGYGTPIVPLESCLAHTAVDQDAHGTERLPWNPESVVMGRDYTVFLKTGEKPVIWGDMKFIDQGSKLLRRPLGVGDQLFSAWSSIHLYSPQQGSVQSTGRNDRGQLVPAGLPAIQALAAGSEHCVALTANNQVIAWGWGEHGNCGEELDEKGNVAERWNAIQMPRLDDERLMAKGVAAGCATSFVICGIKDG